VEQDTNQEERQQEETSTVVSTEAEKVSEQKTYTQEEVQKIEKEKQRFQGEADRYSYMHSQTQKQLQDLQNEFERQERERDRRELEAAADEPEKLSAIQIRQQNRARDKDLKAKEATIQANAQKYEQDLQNWYQKAVKLSEETGAKISDLMAATTDIHMEDLAKFHKERMKEAQAVSTKEEPKFESGVSSAPGKRVFNKESLDKMTTAELMAIEKELDEAHKSGKIR